MLSVKFIDFWNGFNPEDNYFIRLLRQKYEVSVLPSSDNAEPDLLFFSAFGFKHLRYECLKIYFTGENDVPDFNECDYAFSAHYLDFHGRSCRLPLYVVNGDYAKLREGKVLKIGEAEALSRPFCSVVVSNSRESCDPRRNVIIDTLSKNHEMAFGGSYRNNVGGKVADKKEFIAKYKFNLAPENSSVEGYTTEKLSEPLLSGTVPIYWGNPDAADDFNAASFINMTDFASINAAIRRIDEVDADRAMYMDMLNAPKLPNEAKDWDSIAGEFLVKAIEAKKRPLECHGQIYTHNRRQLIKEYLYSVKILRGITRRIHHIK
jgi:hypothetical protein